MPGSLTQPPRRPVAGQTPKTLPYESGWSGSETRPRRPRAAKTSRKTAFGRKRAKLYL
jgi:hypothetical protein